MTTRADQHAHTSPFPRTQLSKHGLTPSVPRSFSTLLTPPHSTLQKTPPPLSLHTDLALPAPTPLVSRIQAYAKQHLPTPTLNHSLRVYKLGLAIQQAHFPTWVFCRETWLFCCLLHDIGTVPGNLRGTALSFEFWGAVEALRVVSGEGSGWHGVAHGADGARADGSNMGTARSAGVEGAVEEITGSALGSEPPVDSDTTGEDAQEDKVERRLQAESVAEAVWRHQDVGEEGTITAVGACLQFATILDNLSNHSDLIHPDTLREIQENHPRLGWSKCFAATIREENGTKPWAHTTALGEDQFPDGVLGSEFAKKYE
ncbi:MAG: hypothetical protein M1831_001652 [Alyxoria varia]|nr:MAG: hypothetical protein M1831_001652 [Alyxoria varia]